MRAIGAALALLGASPAGAGILINGYEHSGEWTGAATLYADAHGRLDAVRDNQFLYLRLGRPQGALSGADLYVGSGGERKFMLHVSSALSEDADLKGQTEFEYGEWGRNKDWTVNPITAYSGSDGKMKFVAPDIHEYQIALSKLPASDVRLMIVFKRPEARLPAGADTIDSAKWLPLDLAKVPRLRPSPAGTAGGRR